MILADLASFNGVNPRVIFAVYCKFFYVTDFNIALIKQCGSSRQTERLGPDKIFYILSQGQVNNINNTHPISKLRFHVIFYLHCFY